MAVKLRLVLLLLYHAAKWCSRPPRLGANWPRWRLVCSRKATGRAPMSVCWPCRVGPKLLLLLLLCHAANM